VREALRAAVPSLHFLHLTLSEHQALERLASRTDQFYPPSLVGGDFAVLEDPDGEPRVHRLDATEHVDRLVEQATRWLAPAFNNA
jgi:gluconokinase